MKQVYNYKLGVWLLLFDCAVDISVLCLFLMVLYNILSYDVASGSEMTPCIKIYKPLVVYRFSGNAMK